MVEAGTMQAPQIVGRGIGSGRSVDAGGNVELKAARDDRGVARACAGSWEDALAAAPRHIVSGGDRTIERAIDVAYDRNAPRQLCQFHLLRGYKRNIGGVGFSEARRCLDRMIWSKRGSMSVG